MITKQTDPVAWALLIYELEDAQEGIASLFKDMLADKEFSEIEFGIHMRHIYGHLNRAWNRRSLDDQLIDSDEPSGKYSSFPSGLEPL